MEEKQNKYLGELLIRLGNKEISVLAEIYIIMRKILYVVGNIYYKQIADIEDAIQDLLVILCYKAPKFKKNKNACAWIISVYQNSIRNSLRGKGREEQLEVFYDLDKYDKVVSEKYIENHAFISEMFSKMTEYEQQLFIYRYWGSCSISEIAKIMKKPKSTIESQLNKIKDKFN